MSQKMLHAPLLSLSKKAVFRHCQGSTCQCNKAGMYKPKSCLFKIQYTLPLSYEVPFYPQKAMFVPKMVLILISIAIRFLKQYRSAKE